MDIVVFYDNTCNSASASYAYGKVSWDFLISKPSLLPPWNVQPFLEIFGFGATAYAVWALPFWFLLISDSSFIFPGSVSLHLGSCSQVVFSSYILSLALSFTLIVLTTVSKTADSSRGLATVNFWTGLCTFSTLNSTFQKLNKQRLPPTAHTRT